MSRYINLTGIKFGNWLVISPVSSPIGIKNSTQYWKCKCDCGKEKNVASVSLTRGTSKSCGCYRYRGIIDLVNKKFGRLVVIKFYKKNKHGGSDWECLCECGKIKIAHGSNLISGGTKSCGCLHDESSRNNGFKRLLPPGESSFNSLYSGYKRKSRERGYDFKLTVIEFRKLVTSNCFYCNKEPLQIMRTLGRNKGTPFIYNGIDRVDTCKGYIINNCVPCCKECNYKKSDVTIDICRKTIDFIDKNKTD